MSNPNDSFIGERPEQSEPTESDLREQAIAGLEKLFDTLTTARFCGLWPTQETILKAEAALVQMKADSDAIANAQFDASEVVRLKAELAAAVADKKRMDWLDTNAAEINCITGHDWFDDIMFKPATFQAGTARLAVDNAMGDVR